MLDITRYALELQPIPEQAYRMLGRGAVLDAVSMPGRGHRCPIAIVAAR